MQNEEKQKSSTEWWRSLSINEMKTIANKYLLEYEVSMVIGDKVKYTSNSKYHSLIIEMWEKELAMQTNEQPSAWDFVQKYYPDYYHANEIAWNDDLCKLVDNDYGEGDCADKLLQSEYGGDINNPQIKIDFLQSLTEVYETAMLNFLKSQTNV